MMALDGGKVSAEMSQLINLHIIMYQPTAAAFDQQGYETLVGANRVAMPGIERIVNSAIDLLHELWQERGNTP